MPEEIVITKKKLALLMQIMGEKVGLVMDDEDFIGARTFKSVAKDFVGDLLIDLGGNFIDLPRSAIKAYRRGLIIGMESRTDIEKEDAE